MIFQYYISIIWRGFFRSFQLLSVALLFVVLVGPDWPDFQDERYQLDGILEQRHFDFVAWAANAMAAKGEAALANGDAYLDDTNRQQFVLNYLTLLKEVRSLEAQVNKIYADPDITDPAEESRALQGQINGKRSDLTEMQPIAEAIVEDQVGAILAEEGFDLLGQTWPPVQMHMTPLPLILIVSPREEIQQIHNIPLEHGLPLGTQENIESTILDAIDRSSLVVPIGGIGFFPAMIVETSSINFLANTTAHEWAHHWLTLHPLGISYAATPSLRTMNETVASIVGDEIGAKVIERYYPEFIIIEAKPTLEPDETPSFDIDVEMAKTRIRADELLAEGLVEEAEEYMEQRRQFLWDNGYRFRKINQAFFAFYGAYADTPGETGTDPIGPTLLAIREDSPSLREFMDRVAPLTSAEDLFELALNP